MLGTRKSAEERRREKERKKRGTRKYGQASFKHSRRGISSCVSGFTGLFILGGCIFYAFAERGNAHGIIGGFAILSAVLSINGRERNYLTCKIGLPVSFLSVVFFLAIFIGGLS